MKSSSYISALKPIAILPLVLIIVAWELGLSFNRQATLQNEGRRTFAAWFASTQAQEWFKFAVIDLKPVEITWQHLVNHRKVEGVGFVDVNAALDPNENQMIASERSCQVRVTVAPLEGANWSVLLAGRFRSGTNAGDVGQTTWESRLIPDPKEHLQAVMLDAGLAGNTTESFVASFARLQHSLAEKTADVPSLGLKFEVVTGLWAIAIVLACTLSIMRNRLELALEYWSDDSDETWYLLDTRRKSERLITVLWLVAVWLSTWVVNGALLMTLTEKILADGAISSLVHDVCCFGAVVGLMIFDWRMTEDMWKLFMELWHLSSGLLNKPV